MSDSRHQDWKNMGWSQMQATLDEELPVRKTLNFYPKFNHVALVLAFGLIGFLLFQNQKLDNQLNEKSTQLTLLETRLDLNALNDAVENKLATLQGDIPASTNNAGRSDKRLQSYKGYNNSNDVEVIALEDKENREIFDQTGFDQLPVNDLKLFKDQTDIPVYEKVYQRNLSGSMDEIAQNGKPNDDLELHFNMAPANHAEKDKGLYAFVNTRSDVQMYGAMLGMFTRFDISPSMFIQAGLGYVWSKNDYAIQATQIDEVVLTNQITGARTIQRIEYPTRIVVDDLHYLHIPVSFNYQISPRLSLGTGIEGRFLINNYYSAEPGKDYNLRVEPYTDRSTGKIGQPHDYDLRKYALGAIGSLEYRLNERYGLVARHYMGLINISGDKVYNARNEIRNSSFNAGLKVYL